MSTTSYDQEFLIRHRLPRPISRAYESVCLAGDGDDLAFRCRWCAQVALRFLALLRQATRVAAEGSDSINPPSGADLRPGVLDAARRAPATAAFAEKLAGIDALLLQRLIEPDPGSGCHEASALSDALIPLIPLASTRVVILEEYSYNVLLGPRIEYPATGGGAVPVPPSLPVGVPLLVDSETGWFLNLSPLAIWEKRPQDAFGHLFILRRVDQQQGHYTEDGVPGAPGSSRLLAGAPRTGELPAYAELFHVLQSPPARFHDGDELEAYGRVLGLIWRGGTSDVFAACRNDEVPVALKTFEYEVGILDENFWRFLGEERFSNGIGHSGVIGSRRIPSGPWGIVHEQELARSGSLRDLLLVNGVLPVERATGIALELLDILQAVHAKGIVHNDVKPENILFDAAGRVKLIDFGIACAPAEECNPLRPGAPAGTRGYMAPELSSGGHPSAASDLYSAGVVLAEMVSGMKPADPQAVHALREVPSSLGAVLERLLGPQPRKRFAHAGEVAAALRAVRGRLEPVRAVTLDIEGTLIPGYGIWEPRPLLGEFLGFCLRHFQRLFVYTLLDRDEARAVFEELARQGVAPAQFLERYEYVEWPRGADGSLKDLRRCRVPLAQNRILDDMESWIPEDQRNRWIPVRDFAEVRGVDRDLDRAMTRLREGFGIETGPAAPARAGR
ncbi:MAG: serine/threonine-protein kinase [Candidatus Eisenbacteria bacterium]